MLVKKEFWMEKKCWQKCSCLGNKFGSEKIVGRKKFGSGQKKNVDQKKVGRENICEGRPFGGGRGGAKKVIYTYHMPS